MIVCDNSIHYFPNCQNSKLLYFLHKLYFLKFCTTDPHKTYKLVTTFKIISKC